jgi:hypothetical protein
MSAPYILDSRGHKWAVRQTAASGARSFWAQSVDTCPSALPGVVGFYGESENAIRARLGALPKGYLAISDAFSYAPLRVGLIVRRNEDGKEIFCQPGDDENAMRENIAALDEISDDKRATIAAMMLGDYFDA